MDTQSTPPVFLHSFAKIMRLIQRDMCLDIYTCVYIDIICICFTYIVIGAHKITVQFLKILLLCHEYVQREFKKSIVLKHVQSETLKKG